MIQNIVSYFLLEITHVREHFVVFLGGKVIHVRESIVSYFLCEVTHVRGHSVVFLCG